MLQAFQPNLQPSPDHIPTLPLVQLSKRRHRATQADQVLIDQLGNHNRPDIAKHAGESPLAVEESGGESADEREMELDEPDKSRETVAITKDASLFLEDRPNTAASTPHDTSSPTAQSRLPPMATNPQGIDKNDSMDFRNGVAGDHVNSRGNSTASDHKDSISTKDFRPREGDFPKPSGPRSQDLKALAASTTHRYPSFASPVAEGAPMESQTLPAMQNPQDGNPRSPNSQQSLPPLSSLDILDLQDGGNRSGAVGNQGLPALTTSNAMVQSPRNAAFQPNISPWVSIQTFTGFQSVPSPASTLSQHSPRDPHVRGSEQKAMSPPERISTQYSISNTSSSGGNAPPTPSSIDSSQGAMYSNNETSPNGDQSSMDESARKLPPLTASAALNGGFKCDHAGCTAPPFQTQYLLNSHANVHTNVRPHFCPVKTCPRSEGGKGFKRKNEMIRHGLVHQSPGYICPFCPEREHRYPRPDNLQR
ncbi:MAG: hypothetical protein MMC33_002468 [Icmadophila ericetorum]|nr:hypothetical protein [Icmadophila ericetorum]